VRNPGGDSGIAVSSGHHGRGHGPRIFTVIDAADIAEDWYTRSFGPLYPLIYRHRDDREAGEQVSQLAGHLGLHPPARVLDVCCGAGRHAAALLAGGFDVVGVDLSEDLLREAADREGFEGRLACADARALPFGGTFDAVFNLFTSFGYFADEADNQRQLNAMACALRPGGLLVMDLANRAYIESVFRESDMQEIDGVRVEQIRKFVGDRVAKRIDLTFPDGRGACFFESVRLYRPQEMCAMCRAAGLSDANLLGDFDGGPHSPDSPRMIVVAERR